MNNQPSSRPNTLAALRKLEKAASNILIEHEGAGWHWMHLKEAVTVARDVIEKASSK